MDDHITLNHGSGGKMTHDLITNLFVEKFEMSFPLTDSSILPITNNQIAFTTDSYVIDPIFFPGGNIGKLAICGTINDLAVSGATPKYISVSFIIEEGFLFKDLETIVNSMAFEAKKAKVKIVTGDTKVVEKGKCDKIFINTAGIGIINQKHKLIGSGKNILPGDVIIINGNIADHAIAVLGARKQLSFTSNILSDCASLNSLIKELLDNKINIKFMRDITRGGLATVLNELSDIVKLKILVYEESIPINESVRGLCEMMGFDPLYLANEGKVLFVIDESDSIKALEILRNNSLGYNSQIIGKVENKKGSEVVLNTLTGGQRVIGLNTGTQLPRIC